MGHIVQKQVIDIYVTPTFLRSLADEIENDCNTKSSEELTQIREAANLRPYRNIGGRNIEVQFMVDFNYISHAIETKKNI
jgi:hypothetical protein